MATNWNENLVEQRVTYTIEMNGKFYLIENVPARVDVETGEQYFAPETVERIQQLIMGTKEPARTIETAVFDYAA